MKFETKRKIKRFFRQKWKWLLGSAIFLTIGLVIMLIGMHISGWSIIAWLKSGYAITSIIFIVGGLFLLSLAFLLKKQFDALK